MAITFRNDKGSVLTWAELDINFASFFYSASIDGSTLNLYYTSSAGNSIIETSASITLPGGGGTPGGNDKTVQFNNGGAFDGSDSFIYDDKTFSLSNGNNVTASGDYSHAEGFETTSSNDYSHAEGYRTKAIGYSSHAEGWVTQATGGYSHAEGYETFAYGQYSHAEGYQTVAYSNGSHAEGNNTAANGAYSHAEGYSTQTNADYQHVSGRWNTTTDTTSLFIVGNGTGAGTDRKDAFKVTHSSSIAIATQSYTAGGIGANNLPVWTGIEGEMLVGVDKAGTPKIYAYIGGSWRTGSFV